MEKKVVINKMNFKKLPLPAKLTLIGIVPLAFVLFLSIQLYVHRSEKVELLNSYIKRLKRSADISRLIISLQNERQYSFEYTLKLSSLPELKRQRPVTDSLLKLVPFEESLNEFKSYTFLDNLENARKGIDSSRVQPTMVMDYYTNAIFRLNTLNTLPTGSYVYLRPAYKDLVSQKILSEMLTYMGIMTANVYNALYTKQYIPQILMGTYGVYNIYNSYEKELRVKADSQTFEQYNNVKTKTPYAFTVRFLDTAFKKF